MPIRRRSSGSWRLTCRRCQEAITIDAPVESGVNLDSGELATTTFRWRTDGHRRWSINGGEFHVECRACERLYRQERRAARAQVASGAIARALGGGRQFGVELELVFPSHMSRNDIEDALSVAGCNGWRVKSDGSLHGGNAWEVVSPRLRGESGEDEVRTACRVLNRLGATVNRSCGFHAHHDIGDLDINAIKRLAHGWRRSQTVIDNLVSESRRNNSGYCQPLQDYDMTTIDACQSIEQLRGSYLDRYRTLNLNAYGRFGTVEIRQHQGTCDAEKVLTWVQFGQALIDTAKAGELPLEYTSSRLNRVRELLAGINLNESASAFLLGRAVQFGAA